MNHGPLYVGVCVKNIFPNLQVLVLSTRWAPDPVLNGAITPISRVFYRQLPIYKAMYRGYNV